jgi:hypothetical protein
MWISKHVVEITQRITCHFKPNTYFLHTASPLPSILVVLPNRLNRIAPLLNQLTQEQHFQLSQRLKDAKPNLEVDTGLAGKNEI